VAAAIVSFLKGTHVFSLLAFLQDKHITSLCIRIGISFFFDCCFICKFGDMKLFFQEVPLISQEDALVYASI